LTVQFTKMGILMADNPQEKAKKSEKIDSKYTVEYEDGTYTITNELTKEISILNTQDK
jgi:hypothetical protein